MFNTLFSPRCQRYPGKPHPDPLFRLLSLKLPLCIIVDQRLCLLMVYIQTFLNCFRLVIITKYQFLTTGITNILWSSVLHIQYDKLHHISGRHVCRTYGLQYCNPEHPHRLHSQFSSQFVQSFCQTLCLRNCSWKTIQYITIFCILLLNSVNNQITGQFIRYKSP